MFSLSFTEKVTFEQRFKGRSESHGLLRKVHFFFTERATSTKFPKKGHGRPAQLREHWAWPGRQMGTWGNKIPLGLVGHCQVFGFYCEWTGSYSLLDLRNYLNYTLKNVSNSYALLVGLWNNMIGNESWAFLYSPWPQMEATKGLDLRYL